MGPAHKLLPFVPFVLFVSFVSYPTAESRISLGAGPTILILAGHRALERPLELCVADELDSWMTAARDGDAGAFAQVVEACHHLIRATMLRDTANPELADELAQEALVRAWSRREQYRPGTSPRAWLLAIARSRLIDHHRRQDRDRRHLRQLVMQELLRHREDDDLDQLRQERLAALKVCIAELPARHQELLDLVHGQGLSTDDAAAALDLQPPACRQRLSRLQRALRNCAEQRLEQRG